jgi:carbon starvation protein
MLERERDARMVGYGSMMMESFVAVMAMIAAVMLPPGVYFAINAPAGVVGHGAAACATITSWGFPVTLDQMHHLATAVGETSLFSRTGGAPSLAVGMARIFGGALGGSAVLGLWYHFAIMFEALFILSTLDAGTRVARFMLQDLVASIAPALGDSASYANIFVTSMVVVGAWGYFLYFGAIDPLGGINSLWPLFGIANQMLATIALCVATSALIRNRKGRYAWVTLTPLCWLVAVTMTAAFEKILSAAPNIGFLAHAALLAAERSAAGTTPERAAEIARLIWNDRIDAAMTGLFICIVMVILADSLRAWIGLMRSTRLSPTGTQEAAA